MIELKFRVYDPDFDNGKNFYKGRMLYFNSFEDIADWQHWDEYKLENSPLRSVDYMQFVGRFDKNGREIYDGDILTRTDPQCYPDYFKVEWNEERCGFYITYLPSGESYDFAELWGDSEVIGNIHEKPEGME